MEGANVCIQKVQQCVHLVDLVKSFQTSIYYYIYLQTSASVQPRTGLSKFENNSQQLEKTNIGRLSRLYTINTRASAGRTQ